MSPKMGACIQRGPKALASRTPCQFLSGCGSFQRSGPTGGWAKGTPRKMRTPELCLPAPSTTPLAVFTRSAVCAPVVIARASNDTKVKSVVITDDFMCNIPTPKRLKEDDPLVRNQLNASATDKQITTLRLEAGRPFFGDIELSFERHADLPQPPVVEQAAKNRDPMRHAARRVKLRQRVGRVRRPVTARL